MKLTKNKKLGLLIFCAVLLLGALVYFKPQIEGTPYGYREVKSYIQPKEGQAVCQAFMPECGVCPGKVINDKCYVPKGSNSQYE